MTDTTITDVGTVSGLAERGTDVDDGLDRPGVPPTSSFRDLDGNTLDVVEVAS